MSSYFPLFLDISAKKFLLVGGGNIAAWKLEKVLLFSKSITIIAKELGVKTLELITQNDLQYTIKAYEPKDLSEFDIIIVAVDDIALQKEIFDSCVAENKLCNCVDEMKYCNFIFPAMIKRGGLTLAISTSGKSPAVAKYLKKMLDASLPSDIEDFLEYMQTLRNSMPKGEERMRLLSTLTEEYFSKTYTTFCSELKK